MTDQSTLADLFSEGDQITEVTEAPGSLYKITHNRNEFDDETLLVRFLKENPDYETLLEADEKQLESIFYDSQTPNQWNIQLFWVYEDGAKPDDDTREEFERSTRFAIRRCVPIESLADFITPLQRSLEQLEDANPEFHRSDLLDRITRYGLGFLFDDSTNRDRKFKQLLDLSLEDPTPSDRSMDIPTESQSLEDDDSVERKKLKEIDLGPSELETSLGNPFRPNAERRKLPATEFTLVHGPNGSGKTSLFDGAAMGMVGQIKHSKERVDTFPELGVTLEGDTEPLDTKSDVIASRVSEWYGFKPYGREHRHLEFYRVNYHEAGATTRLLESNSNQKIEKTLRRFLFGEELIDARKEKRGLVDILNTRINELQEEVSNLEEQKESKQERKVKTEQVFSDLGSAAGDLSDGGAAMLTRAAKDKEGPISTADIEAVGIGAWTTLRQRLNRLSTAASVIDHIGYSTTRDLQSALESALEDAKEERRRLESAKRQIGEKKALQTLDTYYSEDVDQDIPANVAYVGLLLRTVGITQENLSVIQEVISEIDIDSKYLARVGSVSEWQTVVTEALSEKIDELSDKQKELEEIQDLQEQQRKLQAEIREKTKEYINNETSVSYCPACYSQLDGDTILSRNKPPEFHTEHAPNKAADLEAQLDRLRTDHELLNKNGWTEIDEEIKTATHELASIDAFCDLWRDYVSESEARVVYPYVTETQTEALERAYANTDLLRTDSRSIMQVLTSGCDKVSENLQSIKEDLALSSMTHTLITDRQEEASTRINDIETGLEVLNRHYPTEKNHLEIDVRSDYQLVRSTVETVEEGESVNTSVQELADEIEELSAEIVRTQTSIEDCKQRKEHLNKAFEDAEGEGKLSRLVEQHMDVVGTLFKAFQRPYEFEAVRLAQGDLQVIRRDNQGHESASGMSSGQRAALALAIFVTNNLAHDSAPPVMLLDEPFAHLDDINTISFFNLLIELTIQGERQVLFATANDNIADVLERKIGDSDAFDRVPVLEE
jgi:exonuclease SbcC